jgi:hypothetical protein
LCQTPGDAEADDTGPDHNGFWAMGGENDRCGNRGLPSPGMPGQVHWV